MRPVCPSSMGPLDDQCAKASHPGMARPAQTHAASSVVSGGVVGVERPERARPVRRDQVLIRSATTALVTVAQEHLSPEARLRPTVSRWVCRAPTLVGYGPAHAASELHGSLQALRSYSLVVPTVSRPHRWDRALFRAVNTGLLWVQLAAPKDGQPCSTEGGCAGTAPRPRSMTTTETRDDRAISRKTSLKGAAGRRPAPTRPLMKRLDHSSPPWPGSSWSPPRPAPPWSPRTAWTGTTRSGRTGHGDITDSRLTASAIGHHTTCAAVRSVARAWVDAPAGMTP